MTPRQWIKPVSIAMFVGLAGSGFVQPIAAAESVTARSQILSAATAIGTLSTKADTVPQGSAVVQHVRENLSPELLSGFGLFIYVNKAENGPFAQQMNIFKKTEGGDLVLLYNWRISTGREHGEVDAHGNPQSTATPNGYYELDPNRLYVTHASSQWDEQMPYAMFFDWKPKGRMTGLAIHGTTDQTLSHLGKRDSAGCIRLSLDNAAALSALISQFRRPTPRLVYQERNANTNSLGLLLHNPDGRLQLADGYSVLVVVDEYGEE